MRLLPLTLYFLYSGSEKVHVKRFLGKAWHDNFIAPIGKATYHLKWVIRKYVLVFTSLIWRFYQDHLAEKNIIRRDLAARIILVGSYNPVKLSGFGLRPGSTWIESPDQIIPYCTRRSFVLMHESLARLENMLTEYGCYRPSLTNPSESNGAWR